MKPDFEYQTQVQFIEAVQLVLDGKPVILPMWALEHLMGVRDYNLFVGDWLVSPEPGAKVIHLTDERFQKQYRKSGAAYEA